MNPFLSNELASEHIRDLREAARTRRDEVTPEVTESVTIRHFAERDIDAIRRLAALDSKPEPRGAVLVAEKAGELVAALPLDGSDALADPFKPTADVVALLEHRAKELNAQNREQHFRWNHLPAFRGKFAA